MKQPVPSFKFLALLVCLLAGTTSLTAQKGKLPKIDYPQIKAAYDKLYSVYAGNVAGQEVAQQYLKEVRTFIADSTDFLVPTTDYKIVRCLFEHMLIACKKYPDTLNACLPLKMASDEYDDYLRNGDETSMKLWKEQYKKSFGLNIPLDIQTLYNSRFSVKRGIKAHPDCNFCSSKDTLIQEDNPNSSKPFAMPKLEKTSLPQPRIVKSEQGDMTYLVYKDSTVIIGVGGKRLSKGRTPAEAILHAINNRRYKTRYVEIRPAINDQFGVLPLDGCGSFYEVLLRGSNSADTLLFGPGQFWLAPNGSPENAGRQHNFQQAMEEFANLVIDPISEFGGNVFEFALIGSADGVPMKQTSFRIPYISNEAYKSIRYIDYREKAGKVEYFVNTLRLGNSYDNSHLPFLRAEYLRQSLLNEPKLKVYASRVRVIKGKVEPGRDPKYRSCAILLYLNNDVINGTLKPDLNNYKHSPFAVEP